MLRTHKTLVYSLCLLVSLFVLSSCKTGETSQPEGMKDVHQDKQDTLETEQFITAHLLDSETGLLQTNLGGEEGSDLFLSESLGIWMEYLVVKKDDALFEEAFQTLQKKYINEQQLVPWKINENDDPAVNALIDDLRIIEALFRHGENTKHDGYIEQAKLMGKAVYESHFKDGLFVDFYDVEYGYANNELTLSYMLLQAFDSMKEYEIISEEEWNEIYDFAANMPLENDFYPKSYDLSEEKFSYDSTINMIDQLYIVLHAEPFKIDTNTFFSWLKEAYEKDGKIYGRYNAGTKKPAVDYESASVYALALMVSLERGKMNLATDLYDSMIAMRTDDDKEGYAGGYIYNNEQGDVVTHSFDNLLPLLAERKYLDEQTIQ